MIDTVMKIVNHITQIQSKGLRIKKVNCLGVKKPEKFGIVIKVTNARQESKGRFWKVQIQRKVTYITYC